jgi:chromosome segregation ATPase
MNKLNSIFKKVAELEKNAQEVKLGMHVELALVDDINSNSKKANDLISKVEQLENEFSIAEKRIQDLRKQLNTYKAPAKSLTDSLSNDLEKMAVQSKELGIDFNSIPAYKNGKQSYAFIQGVEKLINEYNKPI